MSTRTGRILVSVAASALALGALACEADGGGSQPPGADPQRPPPSAAAADTASTSSAAAAGIDPAKQAANEEQARADLAADIDGRIAYARYAFGKDVQVRVESGLFVIVAADKGVAFDAAADFAQRALDVYLGSFFARRPDRAVTVDLVQSTHAFLDCCYRQSAECQPGELGKYSRGSRGIIANIAPGLPTISHELIHPLVQTDFPRIPEWFDEGIGALFEKPVFEPAGEMHGADNWRYARLVSALSSGERTKVHLPALFALDNDSFGSADQALHYAEARAFCQWLDERGQLWPFYRAWREHVAEDPTGAKSFAQVTGMTPGDADATWLEWAKARRWK
jgi:hypothetical protein